MFNSPADAVLGDKWIFQQDITAVQFSRITMEFLDENDVEVLDWSSKPPDLNIIENVWEQLASHLYASGRQYNNVFGLKNAIIYACDNIDLHYVYSLYWSIPTCLISAIEKHEKLTSY